MLRRLPPPLLLLRHGRRRCRPAAALPACFLWAAAVTTAAAVAASPGLFLLAPAPARAADLLLSQPTVESPRRGVWRRVFDQIPAGLRPRRDVLVREVSDKEMDAIIAEDVNESARQKDDSVVDGIFVYDENDRPTITLRRSLTAADAPLVFAHELGHLVWDTHLSAADRARFTAVYRQAKAARRLITPYAAESVEEGWAEAFSFFVLKPDILQKRDARVSEALQQICEAQRGKR